VLPALSLRNPSYAETRQTAAVLREAVKGAPVLKMDSKEVVGLGVGN
jgi:hypothetical protein